MLKLTSEHRVRRWNGTIASKTDPRRIRTETESDQISVGMEPNFSKILKCDVKELTNSIRQSDEPELRRRRKNFLQTVQEIRKRLDRTM